MRSPNLPLRMHPCYLTRSCALVACAVCNVSLTNPCCLRSRRPTDLDCALSPRPNFKSFHQVPPMDIFLCAGSTLEADTAAMGSGCVRSMVGREVLRRLCRAGVAGTRVCSSWTVRNAGVSDGQTRLVWLPIQSRASVGWAIFAVEKNVGVLVVVVKTRDCSERRESWAQV